MSFPEIVGNEARLGGLFEAARARRLPHALLFEGPEGIGKFGLALRLAGGLLCAEGPAEPCGRCGPCKRVLARTHPDLFVLDPLELELEQIPLDRVRPRPEDGGASIGDFLELSASENGWRVVLIREAQRLNHAAQNALLKTLEEPGRSVLFVLETSRSDALLSTTLSRCVRVRLTAPESTAAIGIVRARGLDPAAAEELVRMAGGSPGLALVLEAQGVRAMQAALLEALSGRLCALEVVQVLQDIEAEYGGRTPAAEERNRARAFLDLCLAGALDAQRLAAGLPRARLTHVRLAEALAEHPARAVQRWFETLLAARADLERNLAGASSIERALLAWSAPAPKATVRR